MCIRDSLQTAREGLRLIGPLTGAGLFAAFGGSTVAIMDAATFLIAATALSFVTLTEDKPTPEDQHWFACLLYTSRGRLSVLRVQGAALRPSSAAAQDGRGGPAGTEDGAGFL